MPKKIIKRKLRDDEFLKLFQDGLCLRCFRRDRDKGLVCTSCHGVLLQVANAAVPAEYTLEELETILEGLVERCPD